MGVLGYKSSEYKVIGLENRLDTGCTLCSAFLLYTTAHAHCVPVA